MVLRTPAAGLKYTACNKIHAAPMNRPGAGTPAELIFRLPSARIRATREDPWWWVRTTAHERSVSEISGDSRRRAGVDHLGKPTPNTWRGCNKLRIWGIAASATINLHSHHGCSADRRSRSKYRCQLTVRCKSSVEE